jgi:hypothetical protein
MLSPGGEASSATFIISIMNYWQEIVVEKSTRILPGMGIQFIMVPGLYAPEIVISYRGRKIAFFKPSSERAKRVEVRNITSSNISLQGLNNVFWPRYEY